MPNLGGSSGGRAPRRPKSMGSCNDKNAEHFSVDGKSKSATPPVRDGSFHAREEFEARPNNLDFYDWQPGSSSIDNGCQTKKRNEERERGKWSYQPRGHGSSEEGAELGSRKVVNRQLTSDQRAAIGAPGAAGHSSSFHQQRQQLTMSDSDEPDSEQLLGQLVRLQNSIRQASVMLDKIMLLPEPQRSEQKGHLLTILRQLKEEEHGYKVLLRGILTTREVETSLRSGASGNGHSGQHLVDVRRTREDEEDVSDERENVSKPNNRDKFRPHFPVVMSGSQSEMAQLGASADDQGSTVAGSEASAVSLQRHQLQRKLQNLQEKKQQMDDLLEKLQQLKSDQMLLDSGQPDDATNWSMMSSVRASSSADRTADDAEQMLMKMETRHKMKKLKAMRAQLDQLRALTQFYQGGDNDSVPVDGLMGENSSHEENADEGDVDDEEKFISAMLRPKRTRPLRSLSGDNCDEPNSSAHGHGHERQNGTDAASCDSLLQRMDGAGAVAEKMRELEAAGDKLRRLQQLVAMVQTSGMSAEVGAAVSELDDGVENSDAGEHLARDAEDEDQREDEEFYSQKMRDQQKELQSLMEERQRLVKLREDLNKIQENVPNDSVANEGQRVAGHGPRVRHPLDGKWVARDKRAPSAAVSMMKRTVAPPVTQETTQVTFQEPLESVVSNEEVYDQMRWQRMMREEQREKKRGGRVSGDGAPKRYSANQDGRSEGTSTYRSDQYSRTSPSEDVTMATWGGSTAGNLEGIEENENRSNNETGDDEGDDGDNEKDDDDDDDDDEDESDNLLQVEEEEEEEEALNNEEFDEEDFDEDDDDVPDVAPTRKWREKRGNEDNGRLAAARFNNRSLFAKRDQGLSTVQESIQSLKKQMGQLSSAVKKSMARKRQDNNANVSEQATQLQQNQLFLGLNQSYFQLAATQNNLTERFNRLEHLVLHAQSEGLAVHGAYPFDQDPEKPTPSPLQAMAPAWNHVHSPSRSGSLILDPGTASRHQNFGADFMAGPSSSGQRVSPVVPTCPTMGSFRGARYSTRETRDGASAMGRRVADLMRGRYTSTSDLEEPGATSDPRMRKGLPKSPHFEDTDEVVIRQQSSGDARASALAHLASQKVVDAKGDQRFLRSIADDASVSSVPGSCGEPTRKSTGKVTDENDGGSFERQSDEIYSEVASLISQNEHCPDFLIQLFRKLQCLSTDFLRQRALYALQDLACRAPAEPEMRFAFESGQLKMGSGQPGMIPLLRPPGGMDGGPGTSSGQSTPSPCDASQWENPFEHDPLGDTVIHFDKMMQSMRESEQMMAGAIRAGASQTPNARDAAAAGDGGDAVAGATSLRWSNSSARRPSKTDATRAPPTNGKGSDGSISDDTCPRIDAHQLDEQVKEIMMEVIPVIKEHISGICSQPFLQYIEDLTMSLVRQSDLTQPEFERFFRQQLATILKDSLAKFKNRKILDCGEDLLVNLSEILFNELAFFRLMQNLGRSKAKVKAKLLTWRKDSPDILSSESIQKQQKAPRDSSSSESEFGDLTDLESVDVEKEANDAAESVVEVVADSDKDRKQETKNEKYFGVGVAKRAKVANSRDSESAVMDEFVEEDEYYTENMKFLRDNESIDDSFSMDESFSNSNVKIELAPSETKPFTRIGSDEDDEATDEAASADDPYETAVSRDAEKERCDKASTSSATSSSTSMERESSHKGSMEKEEKETDTKEKEKETDTLEKEEKDTDTQEMEPVAVEEDVDNASEPVKGESGSGQVVEPGDEVQVVDIEEEEEEEESDASAIQKIKGTRTAEPESVPTM